MTSDVNARTGTDYFEAGPLGEEHGSANQFYNEWRGIFQDFGLGFFDTYARGGSRNGSGQSRSGGSVHRRDPARPSRRTPDSAQRRSINTVTLTDVIMWETIAIIASLGGLELTLWLLGRHAQRADREMQRKQLEILDGILTELAIHNSQDDGDSPPSKAESEAGHEGGGNAIEDRDQEHLVRH